MPSIATSSSRLFYCAIGLVLLAAIPKSADAGTLLFEDSWPSNGDFDFNDQTVAYNYSFVLDSSNRVTDMKATYNVLAVGATLHNGLYLHLPNVGASNASATVNSGQGFVATHSLAGESDLVIPLLSDTRSLFPGISPTTLINTDPSQARISPSAQVQVDISFATPIQLDTSGAPFDLFIARTSDATHQVHLPQYAGTNSMDTTLFDTGGDASTATRHFINSAGLPFALNIPDFATALGDPNLSVYPSEGTSILSAYPLLSTFASSGGTAATDWYNSPNTQSLFSPAPEPATLSLVGLSAFGFLVRRRPAGI